MSDPLDFILPRVLKMRGYVPGAQPERADIIKLNTNENPFPASDRVIEALRRELDQELLQRYPNPRSQPLRDRLAEKHSGDPGQILVGNGSDEILAIVFRALLEPGRAVVFPDPSYGLYPTLSEISGAQAIGIPVRDDWRLDFPALQRAAGSPTRTPLTVITNPNAPTGLAESKADILAFAKANGGLTLVDEAYAEFGGESVARHAGTQGYPRLMTCNTMSKSHSLAGMRLGWLVAGARLIEQLDKVRDSYNLSRLAQAAGVAALEDEAETLARTGEVIRIREALLRDLDLLGFSTLPSRANFVFTRPPPEAGPAARLFSVLTEQGIIVRYFDRPRLCDFLRITIGTPGQMARLTEVLRSVVNGEL